MAPNMSPARLAELLPAGEGATLRTTLDAVALVAHAALDGHGLQLVGVTDDDERPSVDRVRSGHRLPVTWRMVNEDVRTLRYSVHERTAVLVKVVHMAHHTLVLSTTIQQGAQDGRTSMLEVANDQFLERSKLPWTSDSPDSEANLRALFPEERLERFTEALLQAVLGGTEDDAPSRTRAERGGSAGGASAAEAMPSLSMANAPAAPEGNPLTVGDRDRDPFGSAPMAFPRIPTVPGPTHPGDGMIVGPHHPMFYQDFRPGESGNPIGLPPPGFRPPPGSRFDPVTPLGTQPGSGPRGPIPGPDSGPFRPGGTGDPDWDDVRPPGTEGPTLPGGGPLGGPPGPGRLGGMPGGPRGPSGGFGGDYSSMFS